MDNIVGVVSWGWGCAQKGAPQPSPLHGGAYTQAGVYTQADLYTTRRPLHARVYTQAPTRRRLLSPSLPHLTA